MIAYNPKSNSALQEVGMDVEEALWVTILGKSGGLAIFW
jgi:ABC-type nitrate/sulfonate/bicarbonate transport system ATPase subunit